MIECIYHLNPHPVESFNPLQFLYASIPHSPVPMNDAQTHGTRHHHEHHHSYDDSQVQGGEVNSHLVTALPSTNLSLLLLLVLQSELLHGRDSQQL